MIVAGSILPIAPALPELLVASFARSAPADLTLYATKSCPLSISSGSILNDR
jgi:hypothetical protein